MRLISHQLVWLLFLGASPSLAAFTDYFFAGNNGNSSAPRKCGTMPYGCDPPNMCSKDTLTNKWYCCTPGVSDAVCWTGSPKCEGDTTNSPSPQQTGCVGGTTKYCCLKDTERCTQTTGQFNICWSNLDNDLRAVDGKRLNDTFKSLSSARPSAASYTIARTALLALTTTTPGASSATPVSASSSATPSTAASPSPSPPPNDGGLSGGAIGGIVGGVVGGLALLGLVGFFLWRRRRNNIGKIDPHAQANDPYHGYGYQPSYGSQPGYSPQPAIAEVHASPPSDKYAHVHQPELAEAPAYSNPVEMDASYYQQHAPPK